MPWQFRMLAEGIVTLSRFNNTESTRTFCKTGSPGLRGASFYQGAAGAQKE